MKNFRWFRSRPRTGNIPNYCRKDHHQHNSKDENNHGEDGARGDADNICHPVPSEGVRFTVGEAEDDHETHPLFSELVELHQEGEDFEWREAARWVKFEEDVEEGGNRWSKPHVATISLHFLLELRNYILNGSILLDVEAVSLNKIVDIVVESLVNTSQLRVELLDDVKKAILHRHRHQYERRHSTDIRGSRLPLIQSLTDTGRLSSKNVYELNTDERTIQQSPSEASLHVYAPHPCLAHAGSTLTDTRTANTSSSDLQHKVNQGFMKKIPPGSEASNILIGEVDFLEEAFMAFVRLQNATDLGDLTEVPMPTRFLFVMLGPKGNLWCYHEIGRAMAILLSDEVFHGVAYKAKNREDLLAGIDEFLDDVTVLPPGGWDPNIRIEPPLNVPTQEARRKSVDQDREIDLELEEEEEEKIREANGLKRTGKLFGGLANDFKRKKTWYLSDFKDGFAIQSVASVVFLYFACLTPIITFGGLLGDATQFRLGAIESLLAGFVCGVIYGLFSGQPLTILGSTGPVLVFETILFGFCRDHGLDYLPFRLWIGMWTALILVVMVALDASALVCYITRFTEENFATLISLIFIYKAIEKVLHINHDFPIDTNSNFMKNSECYCTPNENTSIQFIHLNWTELSRLECAKVNGTMEGAGCSPPVYVPDVFLFSIILFFGTFCLAVFLKTFKSTSFFQTKVRMIISDFSIVLAILIMTVIDMFVGLKTPKLDVPSRLQPTWEGRGWLIPWFGKNPWWTSLAAVLPALLATILVFMDQQITAVIVNRKENKLRKGCGYHLDLLIVAINIALCSVFGLPWFVAATVLAMTHVNSLKMESETAAPGEKPQFLGVREQRVTHVLIFVLVGMSVFFTTVLKHIPMPVLFGVFLYMGVSALKGLQFFDRLLIIFMPQKYQPDYIFLRYVETLRVHLFTFIQLACLIILWVIKSYKPTSIAFPLMLVVMIGVRKLLGFVFTQRELKILDDLMPESTKRKREEKKKEKIKVVTGEDSTNNFAIPLANGNILKVPLVKFKEDTELCNPDKPSIKNFKQLPKTELWQRIQQRKESETTTMEPLQSTSTKTRGTVKDALSDDERKRLPTMEEEEENNEV
ncbi:electroneutral sodium bicarbonate exchanger 1-like isoform X2 [Tachypleus tridentatus]|uniref:electroneutral sodium bicarbonate exchanger 1-like isoform X2 n=1 Tax=Tachypleus tridentatus TaxID=6853 RepID=UPI003FD18373